MSWCQQCWHLHVGTQLRTCAASQGQEPGKGSTNLRSPWGGTTGVGTSWARGKQDFASGTCSGAGLAWQETPRVAELQQSQRGVSKKVPIVVSGTSSSLLSATCCHPSRTCWPGRTGLPQEGRTGHGAVAHVVLLSKAQHHPRAVSCYILGSSED